jgi:nucleoside triphosphate pyrophosphatase
VTARPAITDHPITDHPIRLVLASSSPRRAEILTSLGVPFEVDAAHIDESPLPSEGPEATAVRLAGAKAAAVAVRRPDASILAADTLVVLGDAVLGKPADDGEAARMLARLSDREHRVVTGVCLRTASGPGVTLTDWSRVRFARLSEEEILWYVSTGEPRDKAGAYAVQGLGARFVTSIEGSFTNVMGLPAHAVYRLLRETPSLASLALSCS